MIAFDIDGVIADTNKAVFEYVRNTLGVSPSGPVTEYHGIHLAYPIEFQDEVKELVRLAFKYDAGGVYSYAGVIDGALDAVYQVDDKGLFAGYITRRPDRVKLQTISWLDYYHFPVKPIKFHDGTPNKAQAMRELGATVIIEDSPKEAKALYDEGFKVVLVETEYNTSAPKRIERALTVGDAVFWALEYLDGYSALVEANERWEAVQ